MTKTPETLLEENARMRNAIRVLSEVLDEIIALLPTEPDIQKRLRDANAEVRKSL